MVFTVLTVEIFSFKKEFCPDTRSSSYKSLFGF